MVCCTDVNNTHRDMSFPCWYSGLVGDLSLVPHVELLQRDAVVGHVEAIRTQSRELSKAHTHKKRQPTNAGQRHSTRRKEATPQLGLM